MITQSSSTEEVAAKGEDIYRLLREKLEPDHIGEFVSIDVVSGDYRVGPDHLSALDSLQADKPDAIVYTKRIGYDAAVVIGGSWRREASSRQ